MIRKILFNLFAWSIILAVAFPLFWMVVTSVQPQFELFRRPPTMLPEAPMIIAVVGDPEKTGVDQFLGPGRDGYKYSCA